MPSNHGMIDLSNRGNRGNSIAFEAVSKEGVRGYI